MNNIIELIFSLMLGLSSIALFVAIIFALIGYFGQDESKKPKRYALASKLLLIYALTFIIGFGTCVMSFNNY